MSESFNRRKKLLSFVQKAHEGQVRKYTKEPYWIHCLKVARGVQSIVGGLHWEFGLCHDLFEDTWVDKLELQEFLTVNGYTSDEANEIIGVVHECTNEFSKENYPDINWAERKIAENTRLSKASAATKNVKCLDFADNSYMLSDLDPGFCRVYMEEKRAMLNAFISGGDRPDFMCYAMAIGAWMAEAQPENTVTLYTEFDEYFPR